jgi:hypothetical protein
MDLTSVVLACSGPSLLKVNVWEPGLPVVAVSTSIRNPMLHKPTAWALADTVNPNHGPGAGGVWKDPDVLKIVPSWTAGKGGQNVTRVEYLRTSGDERKQIAAGRDWMDGQIPILRDTHKSVTFALGWLASMGAKTIIIAGCDLRCGRPTDQRYGYDHKTHARNMTHLATSLTQTHQSMQRYAASAIRHGIKLLSWSPGSRLEEFMETYGEQPEPDRTLDDRMRVPAPL